MQKLNNIISLKLLFGCVIAALPCYFLIRLFVDFKSGCAYIKVNAETNKSADDTRHISHEDQRN